MALSRYISTQAVSQTKLGIIATENAAVIAPCLFVAMTLVLRKFLVRKDIRKPGKITYPKKVGAILSDYNDIQPAENFVLNETKPPLIQPWRPKYRRTMGLTNATFSEFLPLHDKLLERLALRRRIVAEHGSRVFGSNKVAKPAVDEFYTWLFGTYLPRRYPTVYKLGNEALEGPEPGMFVPLKPPSNIDKMLRIIAENSDQEYFFLHWEGDRYVARAFVDTFTLIDKARHKLNKSGEQARGPVAAYKKKLKMTMDRYIASLPKGKIVQRHSWNLSLSPDLHCPTFNLLTILPISWMMTLQSVLDSVGIGLPRMKKEEVHPDKITIRCERQTLHRLMENDDTLVFTFHIFPRTLREIRDEGQGEAIADAILGLRSTISHLDWYRTSIYWGQAVADWLRD